MLTAGTPYVDCGAWLGPTVLYAASKGALVTAFECDPLAIEGLNWNLSLNSDLIDRVALVEAALSDRDEMVALHADRFGASWSSVFDVVEWEGKRVTFDQSVSVLGLRPAAFSMKPDG